MADNIDNNKIVPDHYERAQALESSLEGVKRVHLNPERTAELRHKAMTLRVAGLSYREIARNMSISAVYAHKLVKAEFTQLAAERSETREHLRSLMGSRYDAILRRLWMDSGIIRNGTTSVLNVPLLDRILRVMDSMVALHGITAITAAEEEGLVIKSSGSRLAMMMMKFVPEESRDAMMAELEKLLATKMAESANDNDIPPEEEQGFVEVQL